MRAGSSSRGGAGTTARARRGPAGVSGLAALVGVVCLAVAASAAPVPRVRTGATGAAPAAVGVGAPNVVTTPITNGVLYDDTGNAANTYYGGQGGHESLDDLHMARGGTLDTLTFEYYDPMSETFSATVRIYGNPSGLDLGATPLIGTWSVSGLTGGRHLVSVPLTGSPSVTASIWASVEFTSTSAGLILKDTPGVGTSHDLYLEDGGFYNFGGSPKANFALRVVDVDFFNLNVTASGPGSVAKSPDQATYGSGTPVQLTANPSPHAHFTGWSGDASGNTNPLPITMDANKNITATFAYDTYALTVNTVGSGTVSKSPDQPGYVFNSTVQLGASPATGYHFVGWSGDTTASTNPLTVTMNSDRSITATFAIDTHTLTVNTTGSGSVARQPDLASYPYGTPVTLTATAATGWSFSGFTGDVTGAIPVAPAGADGFSNPLTVTMDRDRTITATFTIDSYSLAVATVGSGSVAKNPNQASYTYGTPVQLTATPATGWSFAGWSGDTTTATNPLIVPMIRSKSLTATFTINSYTLAVATVGSGSVAKLPDQASYTYGTPVQLTATPGAGYNFAGWSGDTTTATNPLTVPMIRNKSITATFAINSYTLSVSTVGSGSVAKLPSQASYTYGTPVQLTATPATGWSFAGWSGDTTTTTNPLTVPMIRSKSITATFTINSYTLAVATVGSGSVAKAPNQASYTYGTPVQLTATPATGWSFTGWSGDTTTTTNPLTVPMIRNKSLTATFTINSYALNVTITGNGTVTKSPNQASYTYGTPVQLTATASAGNHFVGWSGDASGTTSPTTVTMTSVKNVTATFALDATVVGLATFESGLTGWEGYQSGTLSLASPGYNSNQAAKVTGPASTGEFGINDSPSMVTNTGPAYTPYRISAWVRSDAAHGAVRLRMREYNNSVNQQTVYTNTVTLNTGWQQVTMNVTSLKANSSFDLQVLDQPVANGEVFLVDNIEVDLLPVNLPNLCGNATFEANTTGWAAYNTATLSRVSGGHGGSFALQVAGTASTSTFGADDTPNWITTVAAKNAVYRFSAWVRSAANTGAMRITVNEMSGATKLVSTISNPVTLSTTWQQVSVDCPVTTAGTSLDMKIYDSPVSSRTAETFLMDDVSITLVYTRASAALPLTAVESGGGRALALKASATDVVPDAAAPGDSPATLAVRKLYDDTGNPSNTYYAAQGGAEALDDLHMTAAGAVDSVVFEYYDPAPTGTFAATVNLYDNPGGLDLGAKRIAGPFTVSALPRGRKMVAVAVPHVTTPGASVWVGVQFTSTSAGLVIKSAPSVGTSHDLYMENGALYYFGGSPAANFGIRLVGTPSNVAVGDAPAGALALAPPAPNPFRRGTTLSFTLPVRGAARLELLDVSGRRVLTLADGMHEAGSHSVRWSGNDETGRALRAGLYFVRLEVGAKALTRRVVLLP